MFLFYTSDVQGNRAFLREEEHRHCSKVLRKKLGDFIHCTDGLGQHFQTRITETTKSYTELEILETTTHAILKPSLHIAVALPKNSNRVDFMMEKLVETGTQIITPLLTAHSERKALNVNRYRKKLVSAATQSLKYHFPVLNEVQTLKSFLTNIKENKVLVAHLKAENKQLNELPLSQEDTLIIVGPEGDFSSAELRQFETLQYQCINLGQHRLRTETAAIVASVLFNSRQD